MAERYMTDKTGCLYCGEDFALGDQYHEHHRGGRIHARCLIEHCEGLWRASENRNNSAAVRRQSRDRLETALSYYSATTENYRPETENR